MTRADDFIDPRTMPYDEQAIRDAGAELREQERRINEIRKRTEGESSGRNKA